MGSAHSSTLVYCKKRAFALELPRSPICPRPRSGLFQFALRLEDESENVHGDQRGRMARSQLRFTPRECFALQPFSLAARGGAAGAALQTSNANVSHLCHQCSMQTTMYSPYQYQSHGFCGLPTSTRKLVGTVWGPRRCHIFIQHAAIL